MTKKSKRAQSSSISSMKRPPLTSKVIQSLRKASKRKVIDIQELRDARIKAEKLDASIIKKEQMEKLDPLHAVYVYGQNKMSVLVEQLAELPELLKLNNTYADAEEEYMPHGPPISPLTSSYFYCWGFFDLSIGLHKETFGFVATEVSKEMQADQDLIHVFEIMNASRMGLYAHSGFSAGCVLLRELVTGQELTAKVASGYKGQPGEIWLARVLPPLAKDVGPEYSIVFTTPYTIGTLRGNNFYMVGDEQGWQDYMDRTLEKIKAPNQVAAYERLMKYGLNRHYWNEYIMEAYVNYTKESVVLTGFPDVPFSRPHSRESSIIRDGA